MPAQCAGPCLTLTNGAEWSLSSGRFDPEAATKASFDLSIGDDRLSRIQ
jgi:hypothetical protein